MFSTPSGAAKLSLVVISGLIALKIGVAIVTGSLSIIAQAVDSLLDLVAVAVTFLAVRVAARPADREHPFGHGKAEDIAAIIQAVLIFTAAGLIISSAIRRIATRVPVELTEAGIAVMVVSIVVSIFLSRYLLKVSQTTGSTALEANAHNITVDIYSAAGVLAGLIVIRLTRLDILDPIIALAVALFILKAAYGVLKKSFGGLIDVKLPEAEEAAIKLSIMKHNRELVGFHRLRTRKAGSQRYIDLHVVVPKHISVEDAHRICDEVERDIRRRLPHTSVTIHVEPCREQYDR